MASKAQRDGIITLRAAPALAMRCTGRIAPPNNTAGKHNIGSASVACATLPTTADGSRPRPSAATAQRSRPTVIDAYVARERLGRRVNRRSTPNIATVTTSRNGTSTGNFDATYAAG